MNRLAATVLLCAALSSCNTARAIDPDEYEVWDLDHSAGVHLPDSTTFAAAPEYSEPFLIMGRAEVDALTLATFVRRHNPDFEIEIAEAYLRLGELYGIRGDVALCQAIIETGWFRFADGTAVTADQHNYCGLGVTRRGLRGSSFETIDDGVRAQLQHLYAYACNEPLPEGEPEVDPRFRLVSRGVATTWFDLANRWAMNPNYGKQIHSMYDQLQQSAKSQ